MSQKISNALISVFHKENLEPLVNKLNDLGVSIYSTGGTATFIRDLGAEVNVIEDLTGYPSILGGRVKTLHPKVFGGILARSEVSSDQQELEEYQIPVFDLIIVDLYPFEETLASGATHEEIIEKIDIGGISLIRAAAKNFKDVMIVSNRDQYSRLLEILVESEGSTTIDQRKIFAAEAFDITSHYDTSIFQYFSGGVIDSLKVSERSGRRLRYGENPHQEGTFYGDLEDVLNQLHGKEISYNNMVDIDAAISLIQEFEGETAFAILKHTNACGVSTAQTVKEAYMKAFEADTISAFGGILVTNQEVDTSAAEEINKLFFEVIIAPSYSDAALDQLKSKKNRIILEQKKEIRAGKQFKSLLNGVLEQDNDLSTESAADLNPVTSREVTDEEKKALVFANKIVKHTKSNAIVLARDGQLLASGVGQTSRVDALKQAIEKAKRFGFELQGSVMASDAFFPFPDCVEIAHEEGIDVVVQPGGSVKDQDSIDFCDQHEMAMVFTGIRHFKH